MEKETAKTTPKKRIPWLRNLFRILLIAIIAIQFFQAGKNNQDMEMKNDISTVVNVPDSVKSLLKTACYDCHSNYTNYPWYSNIQPVGWWLKDHIDEGKSHLNFQDFATLKPRPGGRYKTAAELQDHKLEEVRESQEEKWMPLESYTFIHSEARLSDAQRKLLMDWVDAARAELKDKSDTAALAAK
jgi:hypothetical protein